MVAMNQLIKRLLRNHHINQQANRVDSTDDLQEYNNQLLLSRLFYLLIDLYESQMHHPNDILNSLSDSILTRQDQHQQHQQDWTLLLQTNNTIDPLSTLTEQHMASDSIHLYMFDLIHLIGSNFIQTSSFKCSPSFQALNKSNQQILLEKIIQKLTSTIQLTNIQSVASSDLVNNQQIEQQSTLSRNNSSIQISRYFVY